MFDLTKSLSNVRITCRQHVCLLFIPHIIISNCINDMKGTKNRKTTKWHLLTDLWTLFSLFLSFIPRKSLAEYNVIRSNCFSVNNCKHHHHLAIKLITMSITSNIFPNYLTLLSVHLFHVLQPHLAAFIVEN